MGAKPTTLSGLSGLGDIMLTCYGDLSRNRSVGIRLGRGEKLEDILASSSQVGRRRERRNAGRRGRGARSEGLGEHRGSERRTGRIWMGQLGQGATGTVSKGILASSGMVEKKA